MQVLASLLVVSGAFAQEEAPTPLAAVEIFGCNFRDGKGMNDLNAITSRWNKWADGKNMKNYTALTLVPFYYSEEMTYDVLWLGAWPNGAAMGADTAVWIKEGGDIQAGFDKVLKCPVVLQLASLNIRPPAGRPAPGSLTTFSDCKVHEGRTAGEAIEAMFKWSQYLVDNGSDVPQWVNFPVAGATADADYDFKVSTGFSSAEAYGKYLDLYTSRGYRKAGELFGRLMDCNSSRVYVMNPVRVTAQE